MDLNEAYGYTDFRVKGVALDKFSANFANAFGGPPPTSQLSGKISGSRMSSFPAKFPAELEAADVPASVSGMP
jgi:hypothetical protein